MATDDKKSEFEAAFNEDFTRPEVSEDDAFGLTPPPVEETAETTSAPEAGGDASAEAAANDAAAASAKEANDKANEEAGADAKAESTGSLETKTGGDGAAPEGSAAEEASESPAVEAAEVASGAEPGGLDDLSDVPPEDMQKAKSWQGRLKKIEAELKAKADAGAASTGVTTSETAAAAIDEVADNMEAQGDGAAADTIEAVAEQVKSGEITAKEAMQMLAADFGEDFVRMIEIVARGAVEDKVGALGKDVESVISHLSDGAARQHFETIYEAHPDFAEVAESPAFQEFVAANGAEQVVEAGSAKDLVALLTQFKASGETDSGDAANGAPATELPPVEEAAPAAPVAPVDDSAGEEELAAAEGVRSTGLRLPDAPRKGAGDFEAAWDEF